MIKDEKEIKSVKKDEAERNDNVGKGKVAGRR